MVFDAAGQLNQTRFRSDLRWFFVTLFGFFLFLTLTLLILLHSYLNRFEEARAEAWSEKARHAAESMQQYAANPAALSAYLVFLRGRYGFERIDVTTADGKVISSGSAPSQARAIDQRSGAYSSRFHYSDSGIRRMRSIFIAASVIAVSGGGFGCVLLLLYLRRIAAPIEQMLEHAKDFGTPTEARDEAAYLIETFKSSIETLRRQETELKRLHGLEKVRADDLARLSATLTRSITSGFIAIDHEGKVRDLNARAREILSDVDVGTSLQSTDGSEPLRSLLVQAFNMRSVVTRADVEVGENDKKLWLDVTAVPLYDENGAYVGFFALLSDVTRIRQLEGRLRELHALADLGEMSAGVAHEFRNALSTILVALRLAGQQSDPAAQKEKLARAETEARRLADAVEHLLVFARPLRVQRIDVDLREVVQTAASQVASAYDGVSFVLGSGDLTIEGDPVLLSTAFENLMRNAADALCAANRFEPIEVFIDDTQRRVVIRDHGIGLTPEDVPRLMLPFQSNKPDGVGIGLSLARKILLLHGATLALTGTPDVGAEATVSFSEMAHDASGLS